MNGLIIRSSGGGYTYKQKAEMIENMKNIVKLELKKRYLAFAANPDEIDKIADSESTKVVMERYVGYLNKMSEAERDDFFDKSARYIIVKQFDNLVYKSKTVEELDTILKYILSQTHEISLYLHIIKGDSKHVDKVVNRFYNSIEDLEMIHETASYEEGDDYDISRF